MPSKYWIKLFHEILDDPKMGRMTDRLWRRTIELFLIAGDSSGEAKSGQLPAVNDMAWRLRLREEELETDLADLASHGIVRMEDDRWLVTNFNKRQEPMSKDEYMRRLRKERKRDVFVTPELPDGYENVTKGNAEEETEVESEVESDKETEKEEELKQTPALLQANSLGRAIELWADLFPEKPRPRNTTKSVQSKWNVRWKDQFFRDNWEHALQMASQSKSLQEESWFNFQFFIRNDENYQKMIDNWMAWKDEQSNGNQGETRDSVMAALDRRKRQADDN